VKVPGKGSIHVREKAAKEKETLESWVCDRILSHAIEVREKKLKGVFHRLIPIHYF